MRCLTQYSPHFSHITELHCRERETSRQENGNNAFLYSIDGEGRDSVCVWFVLRVVVKSAREHDLYYILLRRSDAMYAEKSFKCVFGLMTIDDLKFGKLIHIYNPYTASLHVEHVDMFCTVLLASLVSK